MSSQCEPDLIVNVMSGIPLRSFHKEGSFAPFDPEVGHEEASIEY
jgi:hypothetical protein